MELLHFLNDICSIYSGKTSFPSAHHLQGNEMTLSFRRSDQVNVQFEKDIVEILDFSSLKWKLSGINIRPSLQEILRFI